MSIHDLKCEAEYFDAIKEGRKLFECRYNDRQYKTGDTLRLTRTKNGAFGLGPPQNLSVQVTYILHDDFRGLQPGWCIMGIK